MFATNTGIAQLKEGKIDTAIERFESAIKLDPMNAQAHYNLAKALRQKGQRAAAQAAYQKAIRLDPRLKPLQ
jgi:Flp pilus assembly protein TadD